MVQQPLYRWFFVLNRYHHAFIRKRLGGRSLEPRMMAVLHHIERGDRPSQEELSAHMGLDKTTVAHSVKSLVEKGYVQRSRDENDRRVYRLSLTAEGQALHRSLGEVFDEWRRGLFEGFSAEELAALEAVLERIAANAARLT